MNSELPQVDMKWWPMIYCNCDSYGRNKNGVNMVAIKMLKKVISVGKSFCKICILFQVVDYRNKHKNDFAVLSFHIISEKFTRHQRAFREILPEILVYLSEI